MVEIMVGEREATIIGKLKMVIGVIPVGGKGLRLGLPFSKEMLPQKNFDFYNPVINHVVSKMELAGAEEIFFIHGNIIKRDIAQYYSNSKYVHLTQDTPNFAGILEVFYNSIKDIDTYNNCEILFGLADSNFDDNPFLEMLRNEGIVCGLFETHPQTKVDRVIKGTKKFQIKSEKNDTNSNYFWGLLKFDMNSLSKLVKETDFSKTTEIGDMLNNCEKTFVYCGRFLDLGTWTNLNTYWKKSQKDTNREIERKYVADEMSFRDFDKLMESQNPIKHLDISSWDYYFYPPENSSIEFVRFREGNKTIDGSACDITIKDKAASSSNRFELSVHLNIHKNPTRNVLDMLQIFGLKFHFKVRKHCSIWWFEKAVIVLYDMTFRSKKIKFLEIELPSGQFVLFNKFENLLSELKGFNSKKVINQSKYEVLSALIR